MPLRAVSYPFREFGRDEYRERVNRARRLMEELEISALLITGEANFRYFTGFNSQSWVSPTRPMFFVLPLTREPIAIVPTGSRVSMQQTSWIVDLRTWMAPCPADDGVSLLVDAIKEAVGTHGRIGAEFGPETQLRMPITDFLRVQKSIAPIEFTDGSLISRTLRMVKSAAEIERVRTIADIVSAGFEALPNGLSLGMTERDACLTLQLDILRRGADKFPYMIAASGRGGYQTINTNPSERVLSAGDIFIIDTGSTVDGYFCDFDRNFAFGPPGGAARRAHELVWKATEAGIEAAVPGARLSDMWHAMARSLGKEAVMGADVGRMGHGLGLQLTEPPSVHPSDQTIIEAGMIITVEPGIAYLDEEGGRKVMVHEENLVVTANGAKLLTRRAPPEMPTIS
jgi:Xaa-Pro dipeptidase